MTGVQTCALPICFPVTICGAFFQNPQRKKYGHQFAEIVTSFNKDSLSLNREGVPDNNIIVDVNQTNERLDRVQGELIKLNKHFGKDIQVIDLPQSRIERKGNKTRIVRKNV